MLSLEQARRFFDPQTWKKGKNLATLDYVNIDSIEFDVDVISGIVKSESSPREYYVEVSFYGNELDSLCACPVAYDCKHAAALCHHVLGGKKRVQSASNQQVDDWLQSFTPEKPKKEISYRLIYILDVSRYLHSSPGLSIKLYQSRILKSGALSKSVKNVYLSDSLLKEEYLTDDERYLIADIIGKRRGFLDIFHDATLVGKLLATGRCFWQTMSDTPLRLGKDKKSHFFWKELGDDVFQLIAKLPNSLTALPLDTPSYYCSKANEIGRLDFGVAAEHADKLLTMPSVSKQQLSWVGPQLRSFLADDMQNIGLPDVQLEQELLTPIPQLHLFSPEYSPEDSFATLVFAYGQIEVRPGNEGHVVHIGNKTIIRDINFEKEAIGLLHDAGFKEVSHYGYYQAPFTLRMHKKHWPSFIHIGVPQLQAKNWEVSFADNFYHQQLSVGGIDAEIEDSDNDFFSLAMNIQVSGKSVPLFPILQSAISQLPKSELVGTEVKEDKYIYVNGEKGQFIPLQLSIIKPILNQFIELFMPNTLDKMGNLTLSRFQGHSMFDGLDEQGIQHQGGKRLKEIAQKLKDFDGIKPVPCPDTIQAEMREYQQKGLDWLQFLREYQLAGILADDMGLGKTLQTIAHLSVEQQAKRLALPSLVIAPTSVIYNWQDEIEKFNPSLKYKVIHGPARQDDLQNLTEYQVVITSYALLPRDLDAYRQHTFYYLILDEAQYIKNTKTQLYSSLLSLKANHRLCLTGTPIENHLGELWAQFNFLLPSFLSNQVQFTRLFRTPIEKQKSQERLALLNKRVRPFILRRTKEKIANELPDKTEIVQTIRLEGKQAELYESVRLTMDEKLKAIIASKGLKRSHIEILDAMLKLRQVCCHPQLLGLASGKKIKQSAKLEYLKDILPELIAEKRRILLFSQFTSMFELIEPELDKLNIRYVKLTGQTKDRQKVLKQFKEEDIPLFLISLKAGGTGLNLTEADTVIHYDPWWNPAVERQATDRAHRIGQSKAVFVYKLIIEGSIEQKIYELQQHKHALAESILSDKLSDKGIELDADTLQSLLTPLGN